MKDGQEDILSLIEPTNVYWGLGLELGEALSWDTIQVRMKAGLYSLLINLFS